MALRDALPEARAVQDGVLVRDRVPEPEAVGLRRRVTGGVPEADMDPDRLGVRMRVPGLAVAEGLLTVGEAVGEPLRLGVGLRDGVPEGRVPDGVALAVGEAVADDRDRDGLRAAVRDGVVVPGDAERDAVRDAMQEAVVTVRVGVGVRVGVHVRFGVGLADAVGPLESVGDGLAVVRVRVWDADSVADGVSGKLTLRDPDGVDTVAVRECGRVDVGVHEAVRAGVALTVRLTDAEAPRVPSAVAVRDRVAEGVRDRVRVALRVRVREIDGVPEADTEAASAPDGDGDAEGGLWEGVRVRVLLSDADGNVVADGDCVICDVQVTDGLPDGPVREGLVDVV